MIVYLSAHYHNWWRHGRHIGRKNEGTVTATVFIRFSWNFEYNICSVLLGLGLHFSNLRHHLLVKMAVEKNVKTGSDVNSKTKCRFILILTRWIRIYTFLVILAKTDRYSGSVCVEIQQRVHNKMTECSFNALAFLFSLCKYLIYVINWDGDFSLKMSLELDHFIMSIEH